MTSPKLIGGNVRWWTVCQTDNAFVTMVIIERLPDATTYLHEDHDLWHCFDLNPTLIFSQAR